jgi:cell division protein FtsI (penicillin-binding protein 3)
MNAWLQALRGWRKGGKPPGAVARQPRSGKGGQALEYASSPLLASPTPPWRSRFLVLLLGLGSCVLVGRAAYIQIVTTDFYQEQGEKRYAHTLVVPASRGRITDRGGQVLAASIPSPSIWMNAREFSATPAQRKALAALVQMPLPELEQRAASGQYFVWLKRQADQTLWNQIEALKQGKEGLKGVYAARDFRRKYPEGEASAHVVGFTDIEDKGLEGVELAYEKALQGRDGSRRVIKDRPGRVVEDVGEQIDPVDGRDIQLAIDSKVQFFAYQRVRDAVAEHGAKAGSVVVLDVKTGEVLALANYPSYQPGVRGKKINGEQLRNRALTDTFEPGSTMKPFIAARAIETGRVTPSTPIQTAPGSMLLSGHTIRDAHPHGVLSVAEVIQKSSNVGTVKLAMQMERREMWELFTHIGLGAKPQLGFPGAVSGRLRPYKAWRPIEQATMSYGYGLSVSLFQLARAYTVFAHDGELMEVSMLRQEQPEGTQRVFSPRTAKAVREMLRMAAAPGGTAPKAMAEGYSVGGKTGTAHKQEGRGYAANKYRAWFVGLAPVDNPRIVVAVMVDEPSKGVYYGGDVAAPVFAQVVSQTLRTLGVAPDLEVKPQIVATRQAAPAVPESFQ